MTMTQFGVRAFFKRHWQLGFVLLVALLLRIPFLSGSFWLDEAAQALESARPLSQQLQIVDDFQPPLLHVWLHFWMSVSRSEWWMRTGVALLPGLATVAALYVLAEKWWGKTAGFWAGLLLATSAFHIFYSQELRPYALPAALAIWSWVVLLNREKKETRVNTVLFIALNSLGLYSSYLYPFVMIGQAFYLGFIVKKWRLLLHTFSATAILFTPWIPSFLEQFNAGQALRTTLPGWQNVVGFGLVRSLLLLVGKFTWGQVDLEPTLTFLVPTAVVLLLTGVSGFSLWKNKNVRQLWVLFCWAGIPLLFILVVSLKVPILQPKRVLYLLPVWYLILSGGCLVFPKLLKKIPANLSHFCLAVVLGMNLWSTWQYWTQPKLQREDWRSVHQHITSSYPPNTTIVAFAFDKPFAPWEWYDQGQLATITPRELYTTAETDLSDFRKVADFQYVLSFDYLQDLTDPDRLMNQEIMRYGFQEVNVLSPATPVGQVRIFVKPNAALSWSMK